ncbi:MAG: glutaredoxin family protein [Oceanospirillaceae bacterium]
MKKFILYSTEHCHLCEIAESLLASILNSDLHTVDVEDIANDDLLISRYGIRIPVLLNLQNNAELQWPFDEATLKDFIA